MTTTTPKAVLNRIRMEKAIVRRLVKDAIAAGYSITVSWARGFDMGETEDGTWPTDRPIASQNVPAIMEAAFACDEAHLFFHRAGDETASPTVTNTQGSQWLNCTHHVYLVFGNDGWDVMCDWSVNCGPFMAGAKALSDKYSS